jgi:hypothetical protein
MKEYLELLVGLLCTCISHFKHRILAGVQFSWASLILMSFLDYAPSIGMCYGIFSLETTGWPHFNVDS